MTCRRYERLIQKKLDGEMTEREEKALASHLEACASCRETLADYEWIARGLATQACGEEAGLTNDVMTRIRGEGRHLRIRPWAIAAAAAAVAVIALGLLFAFQKDSTTGQVAEKEEVVPVEVIPEQPGSILQLVRIDIDVPDVLGNTERVYQENMRTLRMDVATTKEALAKAFDEIARELPLI